MHRLTPILALLILSLPTGWLTSVSARAGAPAIGHAACAVVQAPSCHSVVRVDRALCCAMRSTQPAQRCSAKMERCPCSLTPIPEREPQPHQPAPRPAQRDVLTIAPFAQLTISLGAPTDDRMRPAQAPASLLPRAHNLVQAILGIWRT